MTPAQSLLADLGALRIELQVHGDRLRFRPKAAMTPDLLARLQAHKGELLSMLTGSGVLERFQGGDVQVGNEGPAVAIREGDEQAVPAKGDGVGIVDIVGVTAGQLDSERLERVRTQQVPDFLRVHAPIVPGSPPREQQAAETRSWGRQPDLYPRPDGGLETFVERAERYRAECGGLPPGASRMESEHIGA